jgi:hypothetical protein
MSIRTASLVLAGLLLAGVASAEMKSTESAIESSSASLHLPRVVPGSISIAPCEGGCSPVLLQLTAQTQYFFGEKSVSLNELRELSTSPSLNVSVYFETRSKSITRIVVTDRRQQ